MLSNVGGGLVTWKYRGDAIFTVSQDDTIRAYDISDPANPFIISSFGINEHSHIQNAVFGNTVFLNSVRVSDAAHFIDVYDISNPYEIEFRVLTVPVTISPMVYCSVQMR